jgi:hypothetical protein
LARRPYPAAPQLSGFHRFGRLADRREFPQIGRHARKWHDIGILHVDVQQIPLHGRRHPVTNTLAHDNSAKPLAEGVLDRVANASGKRNDGADQGIDIARPQNAAEVSAGKCARPIF